MARKTAYRRPAQHTLEYDIPKDVDLERAVINHILAGVEIEEAMNKIDEFCFTTQQHSEIFLAASDLFRSQGTLTADQVFDRLQLEASDYRPFTQTHIEYYVRVLRYFRVRRLILIKCLRFIEMVQSDKDNIDTLIDEWANTAEYMKADREPSWQDPNQKTQDPDTEDWYVSPDDPSRYRVQKGKNGMPDYCQKDGKFVGEPKMLFMGYRRVSIPKQSTPEKSQIDKLSKLLDGIIV